MVTLTEGGRGGDNREISCWGDELAISEMRCGGVRTDGVGHKSGN
jgi:hypothetical protein